eukprot:NODE_865_length_3602_cov_0.156437.p2 type:complete len:141 gc:universal NODE_865_length_3602_cov_0.156437:1681-2103(+)
MISPRRRRVVYDAHVQQKRMYNLSCKYCDSLVTTRSTKSALLSDPSKTLYSADIVINVAKSDETIYRRASCGCNLFDVACLRCGNIIGYYVKRPCEGCISGHNGHFHVFLKEGVIAKECYKNVQKMLKTKDKFSHEEVYR